MRKPSSAEKRSALTSMTRSFQSGIHSSLRRASTKPVDCERARTWHDGFISVKGRNQTRMRAALATPLAAAIVILSPCALADNVKRECAESAVAGQKLRDEGKPLAARAEILLCLRYVCPAVVRDHCARWLAQTEASIPSVVIKARESSAGRTVDVTDVTVTIAASRPPRRSTASRCASNRESTR